MDDDTFLSERIPSEFEDELLSDMREFEDELLSESSLREFGYELISLESMQRMYDDEELLSEKTMEDLFSRKTDWILVEDESLGAPSPSKCCWLCEAKISVPYYTGKEILFLHQACVDLPVEIEHELHRGHTLRTVRKTAGRTTQVCSCCNELGYVCYKCSDCEDFVLDIRCALKLFPIHHKSHQHPLIPIHKSDFFHCVASNRIHFGISYKCTAFPSFQVHQDCVPPRIVKLPAHRHHLKLLCSLPESYYGEPILCQICKEDMKEGTCAYHCAKCRYFFHIYDCRFIIHPSEPGELVLVEEEGAHAEAASANCNGCGLKISVPYYVHNSKVRKSDFLHKFCAQLPESVVHHLHPGHDLALRKSKHMCDSCHAPWEGFSYCCPRASCRFSIDIICALKNLHLQHKFHEHALISSHTKAPLACRACNRDSDGPSYKCTTCRFWVHQECASLPMSRKHVAHPHMLKLTYSLHEKGNQFHCHVCRKQIQLHNWAYHCAGCKYYTHVHDCSDPPWTREIVKFDYKAALAAAVLLPAVDDKSVSSLATMFFMEENREDDKRLLFLDPNETCHRCAEILASPCNNCALCTYFLPKSYAELVDDPVSLLNGYSLMLRDTKENSCNGFGMRFHEAKEDGLIVRISSSVLPRYVKHEGHRHVLFTTCIITPTWCSACENDVQGYAFRCNICEFTIDTYCALLPGSIWHGYDKKHPFKLTYYSIEDVEEYVCEICEGDITTMWFFHCAECDHSIHPRCIWKLHIEFGPFIDYDGSPGYNESTLVPTAKTQHPLDCRECKQKETSGCRYSLFRVTIRGNNIMTHLQCLHDIKMERWPSDHKELLGFLAILRSGEDRSNIPSYIQDIYNSWCRRTLKGK